MDIAAPRAPLTPSPCLRLLVLDGRLVEKLRLRSSAAHSPQSLRNLAGVNASNGGLHDGSRWGDEAERSTLPRSLVTEGFRDEGPEALSSGPIDGMPSELSILQPHHAFESRLEVRVRCAYYFRARRARRGGSRARSIRVATPNGRTTLRSRPIQPHRRTHLE